jgi:hypothetical protein
MKASVAVFASVVLCGNAAAESAKYAVDGISLGTQLNFESASYREYRCSPSDQFEGFTWCQTRKETRRQRSATYSLLHSRDGTVLYINRARESGFPNSRKAEDDIQRYSSTIGETPRIVKMPHRSGLTDGLIAVWGDITLEQLDQDSIKVLAEGKGPKKGLLIDFLANFVRSAKLGLPIYRIEGGPGFVWAARFDAKGRGTLRVAAVDASGFLPLPVEQQPVAQLTGDITARPEQRQPESDQTIENTEPKLAGESTTAAELLSKEAAPIETGKTTKLEAEVGPELQDVKIAELDRRVTEKAELNASSGAIIAEPQSNNVAYGLIGGFLLVLTAFMTVIFKNRQRAGALKEQVSRGGTRPIKAGAQSLEIPPRPLSPEAALAKIEAIRQSLLLELLASSPNLVPSPTASSEDRGLSLRPLTALG